MSCIGQPESIDQPGSIGQPESQEDILAACEASLTGADIPPDEDACGWPDPDCGMPAELLALSDAELEELVAAAPSQPAWMMREAWPDGIVPPGGTVPDRDSGSVWPAGFLVRDGSGGGTGFADGGPLDVLAPGAALAGFSDDACAHIGTLSDDELIGVIRAWRRQTSWAQAQELAAVAELARRRPANDTPPGRQFAPPSPATTHQPTPLAHPVSPTPQPAGQAAPPTHPVSSTPQPADQAAPPARPVSLAHESDVGFPRALSEFIADELAAALTLTHTAAEAELGLALDLAIRLPGTAAALRTGRIDLPRAKIIVDGTSSLTAEHAAAVERAVLPRAPEQTTGQLRAAVSRAVLSADPQAARRRREQALRHARVEYWADPEGTASLSGRNLPPASVLAADQRLCRIAAAWKKQGAVGGLDLLRAHAYLALLLGQDVTTPPVSLLPPAQTPGAPAQRRHGPGSGGATAPGCACPASADAQFTPPEAAHTEPDSNTHPGPSHPASTDAQFIPPGLSFPGSEEMVPPLAGSVHLTVPLTTLLGMSDAPGSAAGYGPLDPDSTRALACAAAGHPTTRWLFTVTSPDGQALGHGRARRRATQGGDGSWTVTITARPIASGDCDHHNQEPGYRPSPGLQELIRTRSSTCTFPGCRHPAIRCDLDHSIPYDDGGITCECNLAPLCRRHHRLKQSEDWRLEQTSPGVMAWITPAGRQHVTMPTRE